MPLYGVIGGGRVAGTSDGLGAHPVDQPLKLDDVTATVFRALGLDPETVTHDQLRRPVPISAGKPVLSLFG